MLETGREGKGSAGANIQAHLGQGEAEQTERVDARLGARAERRHRKMTGARRLSIALKTVIAMVAGLFALYPVAWIVSAALSPTNSLVNQTFIPKGASLENFQRLTNDPQHPFMLWMWNSVKVSGITAVIIVSLTALAAYSFSRFRYQGRRTGLLTILLIQLFPNTLAIVSLFLLLQQVGNFIPWLGLNSHGGLILIYSGGALGFNTWLMKGYFDSIPMELD
jgi:ABC-type maltose transport system permease subunit